MSHESAHASAERSRIRTGLSHSPGVRVLALLIAVAIAGGLIGFTWEHASHEATSRPDDASQELPDADTLELRGGGEQGPGSPYR